jgi:RHH-type proline utilization regulon transcriptional repressor/proline dehydrogenase/delta 1-pyrroline-5-carboxylate dehydrogenase
LVEALRAERDDSVVKELIRKYFLSSQKGIALMRLAEALFRIFDTATCIILIRDKIRGGDCRSHLGHNASLFVNDATWGLVIFGRLISTGVEPARAAALTILISNCGRPIIAKASLLPKMLQAASPRGTPAGMADSAAGGYDDGLSAVRPPINILI